MIEISEEIPVPSSPAKVWPVLSNPHAVVECIPLASITGQNEDGSYEGQITIKFGPKSIAFKTQVNLELDHPAYSGRIQSSAKDKLGGTRTNADVKFNVKPAPGGEGSVIHLNGSVEVSGPLATIVEAGASIVMNRLLNSFSECLKSKCAE